MSFGYQQQPYQQPHGNTQSIGFQNQPVNPTNPSFDPVFESFNIQAKVEELDRIKQDIHTASTDKRQTDQLIADITTRIGRLEASTSPITSEEMQADFRKIKSEVDFLRDTLRLQAEGMETIARVFLDFFQAQLSIEEVERLTEIAD